MYGLLHGPRLLILDEPTIGVDVLSQENMIEVLRQVNRELSTTVIISSHNILLQEKLTNRVMLIESGRLCFDGNWDELRRRTQNNCQIKIYSDKWIDFNDFPIARYSCEESTESERMYQKKTIIEFDTARISKVELLHLISLQVSILDITVEEPAINEILIQIMREEEDGKFIYSGKTDK